MASAKEVMKKIEDNEVKFVDLRFTDIRGKEQHITVPISHFDEDRFTDGQAFDGSSMGGWRGVQASDMLLIPDPDTAVMDPFREEPTLILTCDVVEPTEGKGYDRDRARLPVGRRPICSRRVSVTSPTSAPSPSSSSSTA